MAGTGRSTGFAPVAERHARVLILGSMPGRASLEKGEYYGLPRNAFWPIMGELFGADPGLPYAQRLQIMRRAGIALWDVLQSCERPGSLDSSIDDASAVVNDFDTFFIEHPHIRHVFFNGKKAESVFERRIRPALTGDPQSRSYTVLPSTSPAMAMLDFAEKLRRWSAVRECLADRSR